MEKLEFGEVAVLENGKEYVVFSKISDSGNDYVYLMSNFKPLEVKFARQIIDGDTLKLEIVSDKNEKEKLLKLFQKQANL